MTLSSINSTNSTVPTQAIFYFALMTTIKSIRFMATALAEQLQIESNEVDDTCINFSVDCLDADAMLYKNLEQLHATLTQMPHPAEDVEVLPDPRMIKPSPDDHVNQLVEEHSTVNGISQLEDALVLILGVPDAMVSYELPQANEPQGACELNGFQELYELEVLKRRRKMANEPQMNL